MAKTRKQKREEAERRRLNAASKPISERINEIKRSGGSEKELARLEKQRDNMQFGNILKESKPEQVLPKFKKGKSKSKKRNVQKKKQRIK
jgi:hypothetical protein